MPIEKRVEKNKRISLIVPLLSLLAYFLIILLVRLKIFFNLDSLVYNYTPQFWSSGATKFMLFYTNIFEPINSMILISLIGIYFIYKKRWKNFFILAFSTVIVSIVETLSKITIPRIRPERGLIEINEFSYPSGHVVLAFVLFFLLAYFFSDRIKNKFLRMSFIFLNALLFLIVAISRLYLRVHWTTDVFGSIFLGIFAISAVTYAFNRISK